MLPAKVRELALASSRYLREQAHPLKDWAYVRLMGSVITYPDFHHQHKRAVVPCKNRDRHIYQSTKG